MAISISARRRFLSDPEKSDGRASEGVGASIGLAGRQAKHVNGAHFPAAAGSHAGRRKPRPTHQLRQLGWLQVYVRQNAQHGQEPLRRGAVALGYPIRARPGGLHLASPNQVAKNRGRYVVGLGV